MKADLVEEHRWLQQLAGRWRVTFDPPGESEKQAHAAWEDKTRSLGGAWIVSEMTGTMPDGSAATNILTLGYDPARKRYVGSFASSVMTHLWVYEGMLDDTGKVLTLDCEGPDFANPGRTARYQDIITIKDGDSRNFSSRIRNADGTWKPVMSSDYKRIPAA
ncbi:hypothetical protein ADU59_11975 [Pararhizobium polonicum]|uniref:DUF1579 domain-containing protein n=1 Tax=Pararhizobium polonicum TaxID=1612624 RepID=A0A1C7P243_9HYPH|nr:DUF1579 domain-containing protein [Pararhizobium polonicum]OBZ95298.1 hypothetical protein ADU59_11975 [Pararhizobium polonicum]